MPRTKGRDGLKVKQLEALENARMNVGRRLYEAREILIRIQQARKQTHGTLDSLLEPGEARQQEHIAGLEDQAREIDNAIRLFEL